MIPIAINLMILGLALTALVFGIIQFKKIPQYGSGAPGLLSRLFGPRTYGLANIDEGSHPKGHITRFPDVAIPAPSGGGILYLLAKNSATVGNATLAGVGDIPIGVWNGTTTRGTFGGTTTDDLSVPLVIKLFGATAETQLVSINSNVALGDLLVCDANGYAKTLPSATPGAYYVIGRALKAGAAGDNIEFDPTLPIPRSGFVPIFAGILASTTAATADHVLIADLLATDIVNVTLNTVGGAETTVLKAAAAAGQVNITTDAAAVIGATKYNVTAFRAINS